MSLAAAACAHARVNAAARASLLRCSSAPLRQGCGAFTVKARSGMGNTGLHSAASLFSWKNYSHHVLSSDLLFAEMLPSPEHHHGDDGSSRFIKNKFININLLVIQWYLIYCKIFTMKNSDF